jgi:hypothetical protein
MRGIQEEVARFVLDEILTKKGSFSIARTKKYKAQYGRDHIDRLL